MLGNGTAVHREKHRVRAVALLVDRARDHALAGTGFPGDQDRRARGCDPADQPINLGHRSRFETKQRACLIAHELAQRLILVAQTPQSGNLPEPVNQFLVVHRFDDVIGSPGAQRLDCRFHRRKCSHHDERGFNSAAFDRTHQVDPVAIGHLDVAQGHVDIATYQLRGCLGRIACLVDRVAGFRNSLCQNLPDRSFVVDYQNMHRSSPHGRVRVALSGGNRLRCAQWQLDFDACTRTQGGFDPDRSAGGLDDLLA